MCMRRAVCLLICFAAAGALSARPVQIGDGIALDLKSIPISDWSNAGEQAEIPWDLRLSDPHLRIDQRLEVSYLIRLNAKDLNRIGKAHELFFVSRISSADGEWLTKNRDRKSTRLNSSHGYISYAVFCLKKKNLIYLLK